MASILAAHNEMFETVQTMKHHETALRRFVARCEDDEGVLGVIVSGSLSRGAERADSDIDLYLVVTEERWSAAFDRQRLMYVEREGADYPGGYFDIKLTTLSYLDDAVARGDEPVRASFAHSRIAYSVIPDLAERLARAAVVPPEHWREAMMSQLASARLHGGYFLAQGVNRADPLLTAYSAANLAVSASRALLALNRVLFAGPKYLASTVAALPQKPHGFDEALGELVTRPSIVAGENLLSLLEQAADWPLDEESTLSRFVLDNELAWRYRTPLVHNGPTVSPS